MALPGVPISVDDSRGCLGVAHFLLTHMHTDHLRGLKDGWDKGTIYCTPLTRVLLLERFQIEPWRVVAIDVGETRSLRVEGIKGCEAEEVLLDVTPLDANHCPGSAMFLLRGEFGCILHTGDFRFGSDDMLEGIGDKRIDLLVMDNTYCNPDYDFPPREQAADEVLRIVQEHAANFRVLIGVDTLGKEELLVQISRQIGAPLLVTKERMRRLGLIGCPMDAFTTDEAIPWSGKVIERWRLTRETLELYNKHKPTIGIIPSGWAAGSKQPVQQESADPRRIFRVPYSLHSSFSELERFVALVRPCRIQGIVKDAQMDIARSLGHLPFGPSADWSSESSHAVPERSMKTSWPAREGKSVPASHPACRTHGRVRGVVQMLDCEAVGAPDRLERCSISEAIRLSVQGSFVSSSAVAGERTVGLLPRGADEKVHASHGQGEGVGDVEGRLISSVGDLDLWPKTGDASTPRSAAQSLAEPTCHTASANGRIDAHKGLEDVDAAPSHQPGESRAPRKMPAYMYRSKSLGQRLLALYSFGAKHVVQGTLVEPEPLAGESKAEGDNGAAGVGAGSNPHQGAPPTPSTERAPRSPLDEASDGSSSARAGRRSFGAFSPANVPRRSSASGSVGQHEKIGGANARLFSGESLSSLPAEASGMESRDDPSVQAEASSRRVAALAPASCSPIRKKRRSGSAFSVSAFKH